MHNHRPPFDEEIDVTKGMLVVLLGFAGTAAGADQAIRADQTVEVSHLRGNVYLVEDHAYIKENSVFYVGEKSVTVVGSTWTPATARLLAAEIRKITDKPIEHVINPDYHLDRAGGNEYFKSIGASIVATAMTRELLASHWDEMVESMRKSMPAYPKSPLVLPDKTYPGDFSLQGDRVRAFYLGPAHTSDGLFVYFPEERVLYGNCILKERLGNLDSANLAEYPRTLRKLQQLKLDFTTIVAGHWSPLHGPELIDQYLRLLEQHGAR